MIAPTTTEKNRQLCEKLGWKYFYEEDTLGRSFWLRPDGFKIFDGNGELPDHFADTPEGLWDCHQAERNLLFSQRVKYRKNLQVVCSGGLDGLLIAIEECIDTPAPLRAEALWRTLCQ